VVSSGDKKNMAAYLREFYEVSLTRACKTLLFAKSMYYYQSVKDDREVIDKLLELSVARPREGQDKYYQRLRLQGYPWNKKRIQRVYRMLGLNLRRKAKMRVPARVKEPLSQPEKRNRVWSLDFMSDSLMSGRRFRTLNIIDDFNRKAITIEAEFSFPALGVVQVMKRAIEEHGKPDKVRADNGPEFLALDFTRWCEAQGIGVQYIQPGKPMQNGFIERFNRTYRQDILDAHLFEEISQVRILTEEWIKDYNQDRPHEGLGGKTPNAYEQENTIPDSIPLEEENVI
jgi:putative transposase